MISHQLQKTETGESFSAFTFTDGRRIIPAVQNANKRRRAYYSGLFSFSAARGESTVIQFSAHDRDPTTIPFIYYYSIIKSGLPTYTVFIIQPPPTQQGIFFDNTATKIIVLKIQKFSFNKILRHLLKHIYIFVPFVIVLQYLQPAYDLSSSSLLART